MRISRVQLIAQAEARIAELRKAAEDDYARAMEAEAKKAQAYADQTAAHWGTLANRIHDRLSAGQVVLDTDVPDELRRMYGVGYRLSTPTRRSPAVAELTRLVALLQASPDETVSLASLERAGFSLGKLLK